MGSFTLKVIKPKADLINVDLVRTTVRATMDQVAKETIQDFQATTATWVHQPDFVATPTATGYDIGTDDAIYGYVDAGTKPHVIVPKRAKVLRFGTPSTPKTTPRVIGSVAGDTGSTIVRVRSVQHPGSKAREFTIVIAQKWQTEFPLRLNEALGEALKASGS